MKAIAVSLNVICLWWLVFSTVYGLFEFEIFWWWYALMGFATIYAGLFSVGILKKNSALDVSACFFANLVVHGLIWGFVFYGLICWYIAEIKAAPEFDPGNQEFQLGIGFMWASFAAGLATLYMPFLLVGGAGWSVLKVLQEKRKKSKKSFSGSALYVHR